MSYLWILFLWTHVPKLGVSDSGYTFPRNCFCSVFPDFGQLFQTSPFSQNSFERHEIFHNFNCLHSVGFFFNPLRFAVDWKWRGVITKIIDFQIHLWNFNWRLWWFCKTTRNDWVGELYEVHLFCLVYVFPINYLHEPADCNYQFDFFGTTRKN
jgi:hypothetical protein